MDTVIFDRIRSCFFISALFFVPHLSAAYCRGFNVEALPLMVVTRAIASIRSSPTPYMPGREADEVLGRAVFGRSYQRFVDNLRPWQRDPFQVSQALYGERVVCLQALSDTWLNVAACEQYVEGHGDRGWHAITGFMRRDALADSMLVAGADLVVRAPSAIVACSDKSKITVPMGAKLRLGAPVPGAHQLPFAYRVLLPDGRPGEVEAREVTLIAATDNLDDDELRRELVATAKNMIGYPYCWGGRSPFMPEDSSDASSCDCSGLVNLIYRTCGLETPRNAHSMFLSSTRIAHARALKPGDCIFFIRPTAQPRRVHHVLMYVGGGDLIESRVSGGVVVSTVVQRLGRCLEELCDGDIVKLPAQKTVPEIPEEDMIICFGSLLANPATVREMHSYTRGTRLQKLPDYP